MHHHRLSITENLMQFGNNDTCQIKIKEYFIVNLISIQCKSILLNKTLYWILNMACNDSWRVFIDAKYWKELNSWHAIHYYNISMLKRQKYLRNIIIYLLNICWIKRKNCMEVRKSLKTVRDGKLYKSCKGTCDKSSTYARVTKSLNCISIDSKIVFDLLWWIK